MVSFPTALCCWGRSTAVLDDGVWFTGGSAELLSSRPSRDWRVSTAHAPMWASICDSGRGGGEDMMEVMYGCRGIERRFVGVDDVKLRVLSSYLVESGGLLGT